MRDSIEQMPALSKVKDALQNAGFGIETLEKYFVRDDLQDHFLYCGKRRPELYLRDEIRRGISSFSSLANKDEVESGLRKLTHEFVNIHGWLVQFVEASHSPLWTEAVKNAVVIKIEDASAPVIDKEYLAAMWLYAGRAKDYQKIAMFWEAEFLDEAKLFDIFQRHDLTAKWNKEKWRFINEE